MDFDGPATSQFENYKKEFHKTISFIRSENEAQLLITEQVLESSKTCAFVFAESGIQNLIYLWTI